MARNPPVISLDESENSMYISANLRGYGGLVEICGRGQSYHAAAFRMRQAKQEIFFD